MTAPIDAPAAADEQRLLDAVVALAPDLGWSAALNRAAIQVGLSTAAVDLLAPGGPRDLAALLSRRHDQETLAVLSAIDPKSLRMRERIIRAVETRVETAAKSPSATRRLCGFLALPSNALLGLRLAWETADGLWRWAGDVATDENHYSKRAILGAILLGALPIRLANGREAASLFVHGRVANVMSYEAWKAGLPKANLGVGLAQMLGRLRYGANALKPPSS